MTPATFTRVPMSLLSPRRAAQVVYAVRSLRVLVALAAAAHLREALDELRTTRRMHTCASVSIEREVPRRVLSYEHGQHGIFPQDVSTHCSGVRVSLRMILGVLSAS